MSTLIPMMGKTFDFGQSLLAGMDRRKMQNREQAVQQAMLQMYGDTPEGTLASYAPEVLNAAYQREKMAADIASSQTKGARDAEKHDWDRQKAEREQQSFGQEQMAAMAPVADKFIRGLLELPEDQRAEAFQRQAPEISRQFPEFGGVSDRVMADGLLTDDELNDSLRELAPFMSPDKTSSMKELEAIDAYRKESGLPPLSAKEKEQFIRDSGKGVTVNLPENPTEPPSGYMWKDLNDLSQGVEPIPGGPRDEMTPEQAGKTQMLQTAISVLPDIDAMLFTESGEIDRANIANAQIGTPFTEGRTLGQLYELGIQAITRSETGAAMPESEVNNTRRRFQPSTFDSDWTIRAKRKVFEGFMKGSVKLIDPSGRFDTERFDAELNAAEKKATVTIGGGEYSREDLEYTARVEGMTVDEVIEALKRAD